LARAIRIAGTVSTGQINFGRSVKTIAARAGEATSGACAPDKAISGRIDMLPALINDRAERRPKVIGPFNEFRVLWRRTRVQSHEEDVH